MSGTTAGATDTVPATPDAAAPAAFDESTGAVTGFVLDDESMPIGGAQVAITGGQPPYIQETVTDVLGRFSLNNVPPGSYQLFAQKLGYESVGRPVNVVAGEPVTVTVTLVSMRVQQGYHDVWMKKGYFDCSTTITGTTGPCGYLPYVGNVTQIAALFDTHRRAFEYRVYGGVMDVFNEVTWNPGSLATGSTLRNTFSYHNRTTTHWWCSSTGNSPMAFHWERGDDFKTSTEGECTGSGRQVGSGHKAIPYETGEMLRSFLNTGPTTTPAGDINDFGLAWQQNFEIWFGVFYWERAPEGWTAIPD